MATLKNIDHTRNVSIYAAIETPLDDPAVIELATQLQSTKALRCDTPLRDGQITLGEADGCRFLEWIAGSRWAAVVESNLQCLAETTEGEPLLSTWLELDSFVALASEAYVAGVLPPMEEELNSWRERQVRNVYIDAFLLTQGNPQPALASR